MQPLLYHFLCIDLFACLLAVLVRRQILQNIWSQINGGLLLLIWNINKEINAGEGMSTSEARDNLAEQAARKKMQGRQKRGSILIYLSRKFDN